MTTNITIKIDESLLHNVYNYAKRTLADGGYNEKDENTWNVGVKFKNSYTGTYKRAIYESDLNYQNPDDRNKELQVYLTYKIALTNESSYLTKVNRIITIEKTCIKNANKIIPFFTNTELTKCANNLIMSPSFLEVLVWN